MPPQPHVQGELDVGDGQRIWWGRWGAPDGTPAVVLHGGPGSGCTDQWRWFDLDTTDLLLFDQRQCGRSRPHASAPIADLSRNTTPALVSDIERLRRYLGIGRWLVTAISWGTTLALAYAQTHPERVSGMVLVSAGTTSRAEVEWLTRGVGTRFPQQWQAFRDYLPRADRDLDLVAGYHRLLMDPDPAVHAPAALAWCRWEEAHVATDPWPRHDPRYDDPRFRLAFARIVTWYFANHAFLPEGQLLDRMSALAGIPAVLVHGGLDISSPIDTARSLHRRWPGSHLVVVDDAGHGTTVAAVRRAIASLGDASVGEPDQAEQR